MKRSGWLWITIKIIAGALLVVGVALIFALSSRGGAPASEVVFSPTGPTVTLDPILRTLNAVDTSMQAQCTAQPDMPWCHVVTQVTTPTRPAYCVPLPPTQTPNPSPPTPTPDLAHPMVTVVRVTAILFSTVTPLPITHTYDLDPGVSRSDKNRMVIFRCNGDWDEYWLVADDQYRARMSLQPGDVILFSSPPASMMGHRPPEPTKAPSYTPRPTPLPTSTYPPGWQPTPLPTIPPATAYPAGWQPAPWMTMPEGTSYPAPGEGTPYPPP